MAKKQQIPIREPDPLDEGASDEVPQEDTDQIAPRPTVPVRTADNQVISLLKQLKEGMDLQYDELNARLSKIERSQKMLGGFVVGDMQSLAIEELGIREPYASAIRNMEPESMDYILTAFDAVASGIASKRETMRSTFYDNGVDLYSKLSDQLKKDAQTAGDQVGQKYFEYRNQWDKLAELKEEFNDKMILMLFLAFMQLDVAVPSTIQNDMKDLTKRLMDDRKRRSQTFEGGV